MSTQQTLKRQRFFRTMLKVSLALTYLVILAGGVVRTTGSGMGCPDWPKCFGQWIPPISGEALPADYKDHYIEMRRVKNVKLARMVSAMGATDLADRIANDPAIYHENDFVWQRTWTEYVNRLLGALLGLSLIVTLLSSLHYLQKRKKVVLNILAVIVITGFQGWLGSVVVSTNLLPGTITVHMLFAFLIIAGLMRVYVMTSPGRRVMASFTLGNTMPYAMGMLILFTLIQVLLGTQVRQQVDVIAKSFDLGQREQWVDMLGTVFYVHRSFSLLLLAGHGWLLYQVVRHMQHYHAVYRATLWLSAFVMAEIISGIVLAYLSMPRAAQPLHLLLSCMIVGAQTYLLFVFLSRRRIGTGDLSPAT
jgi:heme a synthase